MKRLLDKAALIAIFFAFSTFAHGQWPDHPTPRVPKGPNGQPNLNAAAPKTADGKPDLSGLWEIVRPGAGGQPAQGISDVGPAPAPGAPAALPGGNSPFWNIGAGLKEGLPLQPWAEELRRKRIAANSKDNPDAHCLPIGLMQLHNHPQPRKIIQTPDVTLIVYEANGGIRQIFTDGRRLPNNDPQPWWYGYSVGRWEGDTLVVETTGFRDDGWLDVNGSPLTEAGKMIERFRRPNFGNLEIEVTVDDPKAYTRPWTVKLNQRIMLNTELIEFICLENEKSSRYFDK
jgi:hypothetical protein